MNYNTISDFCKQKNMCKSSVYKELNSGRLKAVKVLGRTLIPDSAIKEWEKSVVTPYPVKDSAKKTVNTP